MSFLHVHRENKLRRKHFGSWKRTCAHLSKHFIFFSLLDLLHVSELIFGVSNSDISVLEMLYFAYTYSKHFLNHMVKLYFAHELSRIFGFHYHHDNIVIAYLYPTGKMDIPKKKIDRIPCFHKLIAFRIFKWIY